MEYQYKLHIDSDYFSWPPALGNISTLGAIYIALTANDTLPYYPLTAEAVNAVT